MAGGFLAIGLAIALTVYYIKRKLRRIFGSADFISELRNQQYETENMPKSLNGLDSVYLPKILKDFPDFNVNRAKDLVKQKIISYLSDKQSVKIHNIVISNYIKTTVESMIVFQTALQFEENNKMVQKRYVLNYSYMIKDAENNVIGANCPNCGAAISSTNQTVCLYCNSRLVNILKNSWEFTLVEEK